MLAAQFLPHAWLTTWFIATAVAALGAATLLCQPVTAQVTGIQFAPVLPPVLENEDGTPVLAPSTPLTVHDLPWLGRLKAPHVPSAVVDPPPDADLAYGAYQRNNYPLAFRYSLPRASAGDRVAQTLLGRLYENGLGVEVDLAAAAQWYQLAAQAGDPEAQYLVGLMYLDGRGINADMTLAADWFEQAAEAGQPEAQYNTGLLYLQGAVRPINLVQAVDYFRRAAEQGIADAQYALGVSYLEGSGVTPSDEQAAHWFHEAARRDHPDAQVEFGILRFQGRGVIADETEAVGWFSRAADKGHPIAMNRLARLLASGRGIQTDHVQAAKWHLLATSAGLFDIALDGYLETLDGGTLQQAERAAAAWTIANKVTGPNPIGLMD